MFSTFLKIPRKEAGYRPVHDRVSDFSEVEQTLNSEDRMTQASRCMDCGVPFCHWACPIDNRMPEWQEALSKGKWQQAYEILVSTNNFPEFTGRVCPAICEKSCVLMLDKQPVTIRENEAAVVEHAFQEGFVKPRLPAFRTGKKIAVIGSGPAGLAAADLLNQNGHTVVVFEKDEAPGGLLRFGIPDFKLNKEVIERRLQILREEGILFQCSMLVGEDIKHKDLLESFDAVCLAVGAGQPRDLPVDGRGMPGIHFALDYLRQQNRLVSGEEIPLGQRISARGKRVLVIGGGDTGSDCVGTAVRQKAKEILQIEILPQPPARENQATPWPQWPDVLRTSSSHLEGCTRRWNLSTKRFIAENGRLSAVEVAEVEWFQTPGGKKEMKETGKTEIIPADLVLLSMGFVHPVHEGLLDDLKVQYNARGNVAEISPGRSSVSRVFIAGDMVTGPGLVVRAMDSGRKAAAQISQYLTFNF